MNSHFGGIVVKTKTHGNQSNSTLLAALLIVVALFCTAPLVLAAGSAAGAKISPPASGVVNFYPTGVFFFDQFVGTIGPVQNVTLTNNGAAALSITKIAASAGFTQSN